VRPKNQKSFHLLYFVLSPFFTLIYYLNNYKKRKAKNVMWLFTVFYAATFAVGRENQGSDINRYIEEIFYLNNYRLNQNGILEYYYSSGEFDVLRTILAFIVSYFTSNGYFLIIVFGIIFGYFYSRNIWYVLERLEGRIKSFTRILIFSLFLIVPIWFMNGFRFWTAMHVFLFGLLPYFFEGKRKSLIWCFLTPFVFHFSFLIALVPLSVYLLLGDRIKYYFITFIITIFVSNININQFNKLLSNYAPKILIERSDSYTDEKKVEEFRNSENESSKVWYAVYYGKSLKWVLFFLLIYYYLTYKRELLKAHNKKYLKLLAFIFLFSTVANLMSTIPSGGRFLSLANLLAIVFIILIFQNYSTTKNEKMIAFLATPFLIFFIVVAIRLSWYSLSMTAIIGNPIIAIITFGENISLNDIIKGI